MRYNTLKVVFVTVTIIANFGGWYIVITWFPRETRYTNRVRCITTHNPV